MKELLKSCVYGSTSNRTAIEQHSIRVPEEIILKTWVISADIEDHIKRILEFKRIGFTHIVFSSLSPDEKIPDLRG
jgi:hypothetical protein